MRWIAMDFWANLALAFSFASHRQKKEQQKRAEEIKSHWIEIANSVFHLGLLLNSCAFLSGKLSIRANRMP